MGKKILIAALLAIIFAAALVEYFYVKNAVEGLTASLERVRDALVQDDGGKAVQTAEDFNQLWDDEKQRFEALYDHEEVDVISATAARIQSACMAGNRDDALEEVSAALFYVHHLYEMIGVRWENIL